MGTLWARTGAIECILFLIQMYFPDPKEVFVQGWMLANDVYRHQSCSTIQLLPGTVLL